MRNPITWARDQMRGQLVPASSLHFGPMQLVEPQMVPTGTPVIQFTPFDFNKSMRAGSQAANTIYANPRSRVTF